MPTAPIKKRCNTGYNCGGTCIEKRDECQNKVTNISFANKLNETHRIARGGFNDIQQKTHDEIIDKVTKLFDTEKAAELFKVTAANFENKDDVKLTGDIRHQLRVDGESYDKILDNARATSGLDNSQWNKVYNSSKNKIEGIMTKKLLKSKEEECLG